MANAVGFSGGKIVKIKTGQNLDVGTGDLLVTNVKAQDGSSAIAIADSTGDVTLSADLVVGGDLTVSGANNVVSATNVQYQDTLLELAMEDDGNGGVQVPTTQTVKDIGLIFHIHDGSSASKEALFFDASDGEYYLHSGVTESNGVLSGGSLATLNANITGDVTGDLTGNVTGNVTGNTSGTAGSLASPQNFSLTGDVTASAVSFNGTGAVALSTTIASGAVEYSMIDSAAIKDEDNMVSDSNVHLATQQSIKAYVDSQVGASSFTIQDEDGGTGDVTFNVGTDTLKFVDDSNANISFSVTETSNVVSVAATLPSAVALGSDSLIQAEKFVNSLVADTGSSITLKGVLAISSNGKVKLADNANSTLDNVIGVCIDADGSGNAPSAGDTVFFATMGSITPVIAKSGQTWTAGQEIYLDASTNNGECSNVAPTTSGTAVIRVGYCVDATTSSETILVMPQFIMDN